MIREVEYLSQARAENFRPLAREAIISITGSDHPRARLRKGWTRILRLVFDDVEAPFFNAIDFDNAHAVEILAWLKKVEGRVDRVYVHCHAGKHRSAGVAKFIAERYDIPGGIHVYPDYNQRVYRILARSWRRRNDLHPWWTQDAHPEGRFLRVALPQIVPEFHLGHVPVL